MNNNYKNFANNILQLLLRAIFIDSSIKKYLVWIAFFTTFEVFLAVILNYWHRSWYDELDQKHFANAVYLLVSVAFILAAKIIIVTENWTINSNMAVKIRLALYEYFGKDVLNDGACEVSCQRMTYDLAQFSKISSKIIYSAILCGIKLPVFAYILYQSSGFGLLCAAFLYAIIGAYISDKIATPIVVLDYKVESAEGHLRRQAIEQIKSEIKLLPDISAVINATLELIKGEKKLQYMQQIYFGISLYLPWFILLPMYMNGKITLGLMFQSIMAYDILVAAMAFFTSNRESLVVLRATILRLKELGGS